MRYAFIALLPLALVACGAPEAPDTDVPAPAPPPAETATPAATPPPAPPQIVEVTGTWTQTSGGNPRVAFTSLDGEALFAVTCVAANAESPAPMLQIDSVTSTDAPGTSIDIFSSSSNASLPAGEANAPGMISGFTETSGTVPFALARGAGEIRIVSGTRGYTFQTDPMLKQLIDACHPPYQAPVEDQPATETDAEETAEKEAPEGN